MRQELVESIAQTFQKPWLGYAGYFGLTLWLFNVAMGNGPFIDGLPIKNGNFPWLC